MPPRKSRPSATTSAADYCHDQQRYDTLPSLLSRALLGYQHRVYGEELAEAPRDAAPWGSLSNHHRPD